VGQNGGSVGGQGIIKIGRIREPRLNVVIPGGAFCLFIHAVCRQRRKSMWVQVTRTKFVAKKSSNLKIVLAEQFYSCLFVQSIAENFKQFKM
jgi:hypothetical protein